MGIFKYTEIMKITFHLVTKKDWEKNQKNDEYRAESLKTQGFIHCCREDQIKYVAEKVLKVKDLLLISIDSEKVKAEIKEDFVPDKDLHSCPHIYGPLNLDAVIKVIDFRPTHIGN